MHKAMAESIYLDYQATTPLAPEVRTEMLKWMTGEEDDSLSGFANAHSAHAPARKAKAAIAIARAQIMALLPQQGQFVFTSGATEAINLALRGTMQRLALSEQLANRRNIITFASEHSAVLETCRTLGREGYKVDILPVMANGLVDWDIYADALTGDTALVAAMLVNNEIGVIQPIEQMAEMAHHKGALFFCDAVQGFGRVPIPQNVDMASVTAHKIHGPKGIGGLYFQDDTEPLPILFGGGQEEGLRPGTLSPALCAGFGIAAKLAHNGSADDLVHVRAIWEDVRAIFADWTLNGDADQRYHGNLNIRHDGVDVARLMSELRHIAFSAGSACSSASAKPSHVLSALGLSTETAKTSIRLGFGRYSDREKIIAACQEIADCAKAML